MDKEEIKKILYDYMKEICHYSQMQVFATSYYQSNFFQKQMDEVMDRLMYFYLELHPATELQEQQMSSQPEVPLKEEQAQPPSGERTFTLEELAFYNGSDDRPAYVAVNGNVYDVSMLLRWAGGTHFGQYAGRDLSGQFMGCHLGRLEVLNNVPIIGVIRN